MKKSLAMLYAFLAGVGALNAGADGFDSPFGSPDGTPRCPGSAQCSDGWQNVQGFRVNNHLGEDWNFGFGSDDLGKPIFAAAEGDVVYAQDVGGDGSWRGVIIILHTAAGFRVPGGGTVGQVKTMYAHLDPVKINDWAAIGSHVLRGQQIGVIGPTPIGSTGPHLHFEIRTDASIGVGPGYSKNAAGWVSPSEFIDVNRPGQLVSGSTAGVFLNPDGPSGMVVSGVGTTHFSWSRPLDPGKPPSSLTFSGASFSGRQGAQFSIGSLTYTNAIGAGGSAAESVALRISFAFHVTSGLTRTQEFTFRIVTTLNSGGGSADADIVRLLTPFASELLEVESQLYGLRLLFGEVSKNGFAEVDQLFVLEERFATAELRAELIPAVPYSVTTSGLFTGPVGPSGMTVAGVGTSSFTWGVPFDQVGNNRFDLVGRNITGHTEQSVVLATLTYFNGTTQIGTTANSVDLRLMMQIPSDVLTTNLGFRLELESTVNSSDPRESADKVRIVNPSQTPIIRLGGIDYGLHLGFGTVSVNGYSNVEEFSVQEGRTANVEIRGILSRFILPREGFRLTLRPQSGPVLLTWPTSIGTRYQVQVSTVLPVFSSLSGVITATASTTAFEDPVGTARARFYRIVQLP